MRRFWEKVTELDNGCWLWTGATSNTGYGNFRYEGKTVLAHRFAFLLKKGEIPQGLVLDHLCRNRTCVNPAHLEPVTKRENELRGIGNGSRTHTHCVNGHEFTEQNTSISNGRRRCKTCHAERERKARAEGRRKR